MPMEPKTQAGLLSLLERAARHLQPRTTPQEWRQAYEDFRIHLEQITSNPSIIPVMRSVEHLRIDLASLHTALSHEAEDAALCFCNKALEAIHSELRMLDLRLRYPELTDRQAQLPVLYLNSEYTLTDLVELIVVLYESKVFRTHDGRKAHLISLIRTFEIAFNVRLPNFDVLRNSAINRKIHPTKFLDKLRSTLIELSQK